jgi:hypothetical protein
MPQVMFRRRDLKAALQAAREAGISIASIELRPGGIVIMAGEPTQAVAPENDDAAVDRALEEAIRNAEI